MKLLLWSMIRHLANCIFGTYNIPKDVKYLLRQPRNEERGKYRLVEWVMIEKEKDSAFRS